MKHLALFLLFGCTVTLANAQVKSRNISFKSIVKDSLLIHLDPSYHLIEDSCSSILRKSRFDNVKRIFKGHFTDVDKNDENKILSKGHYSDEGKLDGLFEEYYPSGKLKAKGMFSEGSMKGNWIIYGDDGKTIVEYVEQNGKVRILNFWDAKGKQTVKDGNGSYVNISSQIQWSGKLVNGSPDGTWKSSHVAFSGQQSLSEETFSKGNFVKGRVSGTVYTDKSRINLEPKSFLTALNAEQMLISDKTCDGQQFNKQYFGAHFKDGNGALTEIIRNKVMPVLSKFDFSVLNMRLFRVYGIINEKGVITEVRYIENLNFKHEQELLSALNTLPKFVPAKENGIAVKSNIIFQFSITQGNWYSYKYNFSKYQDYSTFK